MALEHLFATIPSGSKQVIIEKGNKVATVSDEVLKYIFDSLKWIYTSSCGDKKHMGLSYHGYSIIEEDNIERLRTIVGCWISLFELATDEVILRGDFLVDECRYEKVNIKREEIVQELRGIMRVCDLALAQGEKILYNGI